ncbi:hypothetical protein ACFOZY_00530 [Chungangia koreensis]|uniref:Uncharacterized protein n=1 Tax=Chungangia koreensis TaxID=752657 RepID=A0ABV8X1Q2_9LACT
MDFLIGALLFAGLFAIYSAISTVNKNILEQTKELKKMNDYLKNSKEDSQP